MPWWALAVVAALAAAWLRLQQLGAQIVIDDEWHALHKLLRADLLDILTHLDYADYSIPITVYFRLMRDTIGVSEWSMHLPMLVAGLALVVVAPWLVRSWTSLAVRATWVVLLAISPFLVYVSRTARPYAFTALTGTIALVAFERWWRGTTHRRAWAAAYVGATSVAARNAETASASSKKDPERRCAQPRATSSEASDPGDSSAISTGRLRNSNHRESAIACVASS